MLPTIFPSLGIFKQNKTKQTNHQKNYFLWLIYLRLQFPEHCLLPSVDLASNVSTRIKLNSNSGSLDCDYYVGTQQESVFLKILKMQLNYLSNNKKFLR